MFKNLIAAGGRKDRSAARERRADFGSGRSRRRPVRGENRRAFEGLRAARRVKRAALRDGPRGSGVSGKFRRAERERSSALVNRAAARGSVRLRGSVRRVPGKTQRSRRGSQIERSRGNVDRAAARFRRDAVRLRLARAEREQFRLVFGKGKCARRFERDFRRLVGRGERAALRERFRGSGVAVERQRRKLRAVRDDEFRAGDDERAARRGRFDGSVRRFRRGRRVAVFASFVLRRRRVSERGSLGEVFAERQRSRERNGSRVRLRFFAVVAGRFFERPGKVRRAAGNGSSRGRSSRRVSGKRRRSRERKLRVGNGDGAAGDGGKSGVPASLVTGKIQRRSRVESRAAAVHHDERAAACRGNFSGGVFREIFRRVPGKIHARVFRFEPAAGNGDRAALRARAARGVAGKIQRRFGNLKAEILFDAFADENVVGINRVARGAVRVELGVGYENRAAARRRGVGDRAVVFEARRSRTGNFQQPGREDGAARRGEIFRRGFAAAVFVGNFSSVREVPGKDDVAVFAAREADFVHDVGGNESAALRAVVRPFVGDEATIFEARSRADVERRARGGISRRENAPGFLRFVRRARERDVFDGKRHAVEEEDVAGALHGQIDLGRGNRAAAAENFRARRQNFDRARRRRLGAFVPVRVFRSFRRGRVDAKILRDVQIGVVAVSFFLRALGQICFREIFPQRVAVGDVVGIARRLFGENHAGRKRSRREKKGERQFFPGCGKEFHRLKISGRKKRKRRF